MPLARSASKVERITVTLLPTADERSFENVPSTFSALHRSYEWRRSTNMRYMIIPRKISNREILIDFFVDRTAKAATTAKASLKAVEHFVQAKVGSEWKGLKFGGVGRPISAQPPQKMFVRGTIEEMLGAKVIR